jgi:hypothetical protein
MSFGGGGGWVSSSEGKLMIARPTIEPIYMSLPASLHLALGSFTHFTFLLHIRLSLFGTRTWDVIPETCYTLVQLGPGLLPLLPRAGIAVAVLIAFAKPDGADNRDPNFFTSGELTRYARGVVYTFVGWVAVRVVVVGVSLGGVFTEWGARRATSKRDPSKTPTPRKGWVEESEFHWAWRERTRGRIQDAYELCMMRRVGKGVVLREEVRPESGVLPASAPSAKSSRDVFYTPRNTPMVERTAYPSVGGRESVESTTDDSTELLEGSLPGRSVRGVARKLRSGSISTASSSVVETGVRARSNSVSMLRARSISVGMLRENAVRRARSGTMEYRKVGM